MYTEASSGSLADRTEQLVAEALAKLDEATLTERYRSDDGLLVLPELLPKALVRSMASEAEALAPSARRTFVPFVRYGGAVGHYDLAARAPSLRALHQSPSLLAFAQRICSVSLEHRDDRDPHASGLYVYSRRGDWVDWHYDDCGCIPAASFTVIVGVVDESSSCLEVQLHKKSKERALERRSIKTPPGTVVFFQGSSVYHRVSPLRTNERRLSFSFVYLRSGGRPKGVDRLWQTYLDTVLYFGHKGLPRSLDLWRDLFRK